MRRFRLLPAVTLAATLAAGAAATPAAASTVARGSSQAVSAVLGGTAADGAQVVAETQVDARTLDITVASPAAGANVQVRLLLPPGWSPAATATWPVLYLLHGCCDAYSGWTQQTNVAQQTAGAAVIIALPDGGPAGFYTNWYNGGKGGQNYEDFTATELPQILRSGFHASQRQAIGGVSTGGGAALVIAAHHPGAYTAAASYSGMDCTELAQSVATIDATVARAGINPANLWGDPTAQQSIWQQHDPCFLAPALKGTPLFLSVGSGVDTSGNQTTCPAGPGGQVLEAFVAFSVYWFEFTLLTDGVAATTDNYGGGCHDWPWWQTAFGQSWPMLRAALGA
jgi:diacylglycerol O-acyltransferase / trehalose O-mycolyltransferase / mycolyltransferase Ag85